MKSPAKHREQGHISRRDYKKLIKLIDTKIQAAEDQYKYELDQHKDQSNKEPLSDIDTNVILEQRYDEGFFEGSMQALVNLKWSIQEMHERDQSEWKSKSKRGKRSIFYYMFYPFFKLLGLP